jgi:serine/threonine protein kinase/regulation of enolase protein 1 (concanavalin A-like superfamily)
MSDSESREETLLNALRKMRADQRQGFLAEACSAEAGLRKRIEERMKEEGEPGAIDEPAHHPSYEIMRVERADAFECAGSLIGSYKLLELIGEGGCGVVYMAEQAEPVHRRVALKVIKPGMDTKQVLARFEAERQALALMDHPNIAKVLEAGSTQAGRPFFVMELVKGIRITDYCDENKLGTDRRLDLFIQVCQAIQHAHQKGIIHRDIKPSNILVAEHDGVPVPKIIDFGIAKATTDLPLTNKTLFTSLEQFIGTPAYMSPEQAKLSGLDIDTRSDIYSLGVLLYELLTGKTLFDAQRLEDACLDEIRRIIREEDPPRPSTRLSTLTADEQTTIASRRQSQPPKLVSLLRGDLDWIAMKALEKDRQRRYDTADGLARDVQRYLANEPVTARPPTKIYRLQKLVRRHRLAWAAAMAMLATLITALGISLWLLHNEQASQKAALSAEKQSKAEARKSHEVAEFLQSMLKGVEPSVALGRDTTMLREILDKTAERIDKDLGEDPEARIEINDILAEVYHDLRLYPQMASIARANLSLAKATLGETNAAVADALEHLGDALMHLGDLGQSESFNRQALVIRRQLFGAESPSIASVLDHLANVLQAEGKLDQAASLFREELTIRKRKSETGDAETATALNNFAVVRNSQGNPLEAEKMEREAIMICRRTQATDGPDVATCLVNLSTILQSEGKLSEAENPLHQAIALERKLRGNDNPEVFSLLEGLASLLSREGKMAEAESVARDAAIYFDSARINTNGFTASHVAVAKREPGTLARAVRSRILAGWGEVIDPDGDCLVTNENEKLVIQIPGTVHDLQAFKANAPRVLQSVFGDFTIKIKVSGEFEPGAESSCNYAHAYNGAGLLLWADDRNFIRLERNVWVSQGAHYSYTPLLEYCAGGRKLSFAGATSMPFFKGHSTYLRMARRGDELKVALSHDGSEWIEKDPITVQLPKRVKIGFEAVSSSKLPFTVQFSELSLAKDSGDQPTAGSQ